MNDVNMIFNENPSAIGTLVKAFRNRKNPYTPGAAYPTIHATRPGHVIKEDHVRAFHEICDIAGTEHLHILYPFTLAYPYIMRVLCSREMPISLFRVLNTRNSIILHRRIRPDERLDIDCRNSAPRVVSKGLEIDVISEIASGGKTAWENTTTYFLPGKFGPADAAYSALRLDPIGDDTQTAEWYFPAKDRFRFARISGDTNGIHYWNLYARMMGFRRDFAQPIRVVAKCVSSLPSVEPDAPARLDFFLKGPVYYERTLTLKNAGMKNGNRFNLYCSGNDKPVICGILHTAAG